MVSWLELIWWVLWIAGVGAAIGSFVNVLIYRLPRGPVFRPLRSFCPHCERPIRLRDNVPLYSFLALRGRCRHCGGVISERYPLIEAVTILVFLLVFDAFFIAAVRPDIADPDLVTITDRVIDAWPMLLAHLVLAAGLVVISVIDLEEYWIDVRVIVVIVLFGLACHAMWTPDSRTAWQPPSPTLAAAGFGATVGLVVAQLIAWVRARRRSVAFGGDSGLSDTGVGATEPVEDAMAASTAEPAHVDGESDAACGEIAGTAEAPVGAGRRPRLMLGWVSAVAVVGCLGVIIVGQWTGWAVLGFWRRAAGIFVVLYVAHLGASARRRVADTAIVAAIEEERHSARRMAMGELAYLLPAAVLAALAAYCAHAGFWGRFGFSAYYGWAATSEWQPIAGLSRALCGALIAGAVGWGVRIGFTLLFGREAFGLGDVYIMAAAGATAGWGVAVLGFFLAALLALAGVVLLLVFKWSRAIPFGPWLALGIVWVMVAYEPIRRFVEPGLEGLAMLVGLSPGLPPAI